MPTTWEALTTRQQAYLKAIFDLDQAAEQAKAESFRYDRFIDTRPASEWRWIAFAALESALGRLPKGENAEELLTELAELGLLEREEENSSAHLRLKITPAGRKSVRQGLGIAPKRKGELSERQTSYARAIVNAGLASWEEVEAAFRGGVQGQAKVSGWGQALRDRERQARKLAQKEYLASLTRWEPCAYPGCTQKIKVVTYRDNIGASQETPEPTRRITVWSQTPGWHRVGRREMAANGETMSKNLYACPAHTEGVFRLVVGLTLTLDEEAEKRLLAIRYPVAASQQARIAVADLAAASALSHVAQLKLGETPPTDRASTRPWLTRSSPRSWKTLAILSPTI